MTTAANTESNEHTRLLSNTNNEVNNTYSSATNDTTDSEVAPSQDDSNQPQDYVVTPPTTQDTSSPSSPITIGDMITRASRHNEYDDDDDDDDNMSKILQIAKRPSFIWVCCLGVVALIIFQLTFYLELLLQEIIEIGMELN